ncbi:hypothetical protein HPP92_021573 [Vanilla planifolia]|uniref:Uncharacterized protein n=1 Tax=Vanilla planifolia TaxID=51239 RepID=A0A835Q540_VANPL|nr:hypothetical protein HPP92_021905 [Vanilla planifolia]KAG0463097.1 hypothetical protein HPP92_021573 [Vanilla planifolia]
MLSLPGPICSMVIDFLKIKQRMEIVLKFGKRKPRISEQRFRQGLQASTYACPVESSNWMYISVVECLYNGNYMNCIETTGSCTCKDGDEGEETGSLRQRRRPSISCRRSFLPLRFLNFTKNKIILISISLRRLISCCFLWKSATFSYLVRVALEILSSRFRVRHWLSKAPPFRVILPDKLRTEKVAFISESLLFLFWRFLYLFCED